MLSRRTGFLATLAAGMALLGASFHGITSIDHELQVAATTPAPAPSLETVREDWKRPRLRQARDGRGHRDGPEV